MKFLVSSLLILAMLSMVQTANAVDFGKVGTSFEVKEEGFIAMIKRKLSQVDIEEHQRQMIETARKKAVEPVKVKGIRKTVKEQSFTFDLTYTLKEDIYLPGGKLLYKAGTMVNPLEHMSLDKKLIFIDGTDKEQVQWFKDKKADGSFAEKDKLLLIAGKPIDLGNELDREVYFDQAGVLTSKFKIEQVPAIVEQEGKILRIKEVQIEITD